MPPSPKAKNPRIDQQILLDAAMRVFAREGMEGASMRAISREAGCDVSLLYYYFDNKEAIFSALLDARTHPFIRAIRKLAGRQDHRSTAEKLWTAIQLFHTHSVDAGFRSIVRSQISKGVQGMNDLIMRKLTPGQLAMRILIRRGIRQGEIRSDLNPILVATFLIRMEAELMDLVPAFANTFSTSPTEEVLLFAERTWFDVFWRGVAVDPTAPLSFLPPLKTATHPKPQR